MLSFSDIPIVEEDAVEQFVSEGLKRKFDDEIVEGDVPKRVDVDRYRMVPISCTVPGELIKDWIFGDFWGKVEKYLKYQDAESFYDLASPEDLEDTATYTDFCIEQCEHIEDLFWDYTFQEKCLEYLQEYRWFD